MNSPRGSRGPLRAVIMASTGQDVRECTNCDACDDWMAPGMDLTFGEIMQAAARDDPRALENQTLWACDDLLPRVRCPSGIDIASVILALIREAGLRGMRMPDDGRWTTDGERETGDRCL